MASIQLTKIEHHSPNPALFAAPFHFTFSVNVSDDLREDMEVSFVWVGYGDTPLYDQKLEKFVIGPLRLGTNVFEAHVPGPRWDLIPAWDILGETLLLVSLRYCDAEFVRVGYWVSVEYINSTDVPHTVCVERIGRTLSLPSVNTSAINWRLP